MTLHRYLILPTYVEVLSLTMPLPGYLVALNTTGVLAEVLR